MPRMPGVRSVVPLALLVVVVVMVQPASTLAETTEITGEPTDGPTNETTGEPTDGSTNGTTGEPTNEPPLTSTQEPTPPTSTQEPTPPTSTQEPTQPTSTQEPTPPTSTPEPTPPTSTKEPTQPTEKERFTRTKDSFEDIDDTLNNFEALLPDSSDANPLPQPAAAWAVVREGRDTKDTTESSNFDDICPSVPSDDCLALVCCLKQINNLTRQFSLDPNLWTNDDLYDLEAESQLLTTITDRENLKGEIVVTNFAVVFKDMQAVLDEGISTATSEISRLNKEETDTVVFVAVFGSLAGLMMVALIVGLSIAAYKTSAIKNNKKQAAFMKSDGNIPLEPTQTSNPPKESRPADPYSKPAEPQSTNHYSQPSAQPANSRQGSRSVNPYSHNPAPQPPSRSSSDLYSRPHAPKSDRYYTADQVTGTDRYGSRNQGGGLPRIY